MTDIALPHNGWLPRHHQMPLWRYLQGGGKRAMAIWHRRAGKDEICLHHAAFSAMGGLPLQTKAANYVHCLPLYSQGRKSIWNSVNPHSGRRRIDEAFPLELRETTNESEMHIRLTNGSTWSVIGSDTYDTSLVGTSIAGVVFSEFSLANPSAWAYARPVLEENNGWAVFISTPRGRNHCYEMFKYAQQQPDWFCELLTVEDTKALTGEQLAEAKQEYTALYGQDAGIAQYDQEYMCSWSASLLGSMYSYEMKQVRDEGRIAEINPINGPVHRAWDIGMRDDTCVICWQSVGSQVFIYDCISTSGAALDWWVSEIERIYQERGWQHGTDYVPHDAKVREFTAGGRTRVETMQRLGLAPMLVSDATMQDGINAVRRTLPLCVFHPRCEVALIPALEQYRREWDDEKKCFRQSPLHDWCSDRADAMRYLSLAWKPAPRKEHKPPPQTGWRIPPPDEMRPRHDRMRL
jgi:phage terminase large subunit